MLIKTADGEKSVAGKGTTALGIIGTGLGAMALANQNNGCGCNNGLLGGLFGGNNRDCYVTKYELAQTQENAGLKAIIADQNAKMYADQIGLELYRQSQVERNIDKDTQNGVNVAFIRNIADLDKETAVNTAVINKNLELLNQKIDCNAKITDYKFALAEQNTNAKFDLVECRYVPAIKRISLCDICPTPQVLEKVEQPTQVCVG